jgi:hypothetical protein
MANFRDLPPSQQGWIHELARAEIHPDAERLLQLGRAYDPHQMVEEATIDFLTELREHFNEFIRTFNAYSDGGTKFQEMKIYSTAQTAADFMIFRNGVKLIVANTAHGVIQFSFAHHVRGTMSVDGQVHGQVHGAGTQNGLPAGSSGVNPQTHDLLAQIGPFRETFWTFQGEKVKAEQVAKFYFTEFSRITRDTNRSRNSNQLLLDQIKALLQEKGLEL